MDPTSSNMTPTGPAINLVLQKSNQNITMNAAATSSSIRSSLTSLISKDKVVSSKLKKTTLNGQESGKPESLMERDHSRKTSRTSSPTPKSILSTSLHRPKKLMKNPPSEFPSEGEDVYELALETDSLKTLHSTPTQLRSYSLTKRSCLKKNGIGPSNRVPTRSSSADQVIFEVFLPGHRKPVTRTRSITFDESVRVRRVSSVSELSNGKTSEIWFQPEEYETIKRKTYTLVRAIQHGHTRGLNYCTRGLEKYLQAEEVQRTRAAARDSVLFLQEGQRRSGNFDDVQLSHAYRCISSQSMVEAAYRGKRDHESIEKYLLKTKHLLRTTATTIR
jgi:hypothetical protein